MRSLLLAVLAGSALASASILQPRAFPKCAQQCWDVSIGRSNCPSDKASCICLDQTILSDFGTCFDSTCTDDPLPVIKDVYAFCDVPVPKSVLDQFSTTKTRSSTSRTSTSTSTSDSSKTTSSDSSSTTSKPTDTCSGSSTSCSDSGTPTPSQTETNTPDKPEQAGLSTGAKIGLGVGIPIGVLAIAAAIFLVFRRKKASNTDVTPAGADSFLAGGNPNAPSNQQMSTIHQNGSHPGGVAGGIVGGVAGAGAAGLAENSLSQASSSQYNYPPPPGHAPAELPHHPAPNQVPPNQVPPHHPAHYQQPPPTTSSPSATATYTAPSDVSGSSYHGQHPSTQQLYPPPPHQLP